MRNTAKTHEQLIAYFLGAWCSLRGLDPAEKVTPTVREIWLEATQDIPLETLRVAMSAMLRNASSKTFMPTPGDLRSLLRDESASEALDAWRELTKRLREFHFDPGAGWVWPFFGDRERAERYAEKHGLTVKADDWERGFYCVPPPLPREIIYAVDVLGGFERLRADLNGPQHDFLRKHFIDAFAAARTNPKLGPGMKQLNPQPERALTDAGHPET